MQFDFDKKEAKVLAEQEKENALAANEKHRQKIILWSIVAGLILVLIFSGLLFQRFRVTQKQKQTIELQKN